VLAGQTAEPPNDFAFRFTRTCPDETIDMFGGTYARKTDWRGNRFRRAWSKRCDSGTSVSECSFSQLDYGH
jgi:hypothetical protein